MAKLKVTKYRRRKIGWSCTVEPPVRSWIMFVSKDGTPVLFTKRNPDGSVE